MSDSGMHQHGGFDPVLQVTTLDGAHSHEFRLPDGSTVQTSEDGGHAHTIETGNTDRPYAYSGGVHAHTVIVDGVKLRTEVDGWHTHEVGENTIALGGVHSHALVLPTGETVISLFVSTGKSNTKRGAERKRAPTTNAHLDAVEASAKAVLKRLREQPVEKTENQKAAERYFESDDLAPPRVSVIRYDPITRKIIR